MMLDKTTLENASVTAHWLEACAQSSESYAECENCPYLGQACNDGLMEDAAKVLAILYPADHPDHRVAKSVIKWLSLCIAETGCLAICEHCPYTYGCPSGLLRRSAELIRAACHYENE